MTDPQKEQPVLSDGCADNNRFIQSAFTHISDCFNCFRELTREKRVHSSISFIITRRLNECKQTFERRFSVKLRPFQRGKTMDKNTKKAVEPGVSATRVSVPGRAEQECCQMTRAPPPHRRPSNKLKCKSQQWK